MSEAATNPFNSASDLSKLQFYICFRSFRTNFLSVFHDEETGSPQEFRIDRKFPCQAVAKRALCPILSAKRD